MSMRIRKTTPADLPCVMDIYARARQFMADHGNPKQWGGTNWPPEWLIQQDIQQGKSYVCVLEEEGEGVAPNQPVAVFFYDFGEDIEPTYRVITDGSWRDNSPFGVVHRIASDGSRTGIKGIGAFCLNWAFEQCGHLKIDTHGDNTVMQAALEKLGFERRGIIYVEEDNDPRFAYEK